MATTQRTLIRRYTFGSIFQNICITVDGVLLIVLSEQHPEPLLNLFGLLFGSHRISWSERKTARSTLTRVRSGTPTVFSPCSGEDGSSRQDRDGTLCCCSSCHTSTLPAANSEREAASVLASVASVRLPTFSQLSDANLETVSDRWVF